MRRSLSSPGLIRVLIVGLALVLARPAAALVVEEEFVLGPADAAPVLRILSTTDVSAARPFLEAFHNANPDLSIRYTVASTISAYEAIADEQLPFDLVISSAMDLQMKLANDGHARPIPHSAAIDAVPHTARWRDLIVGISVEPVVIVVRSGAFAQGKVPRTRRELIDRLREDPERFRGKVGTYDPATSGAGYLFASQDAAFGSTFWRLAEVIGRLDARLYCCSGAMINDLADGRLLVAYNLVGSYSRARAAEDPRLLVIEPEDFTLQLLRTALVPRSAANPDAALRMLEFLLSDRGVTAINLVPGQSSVLSTPSGRPGASRTIRLDPGLLANLDRIRKDVFLRDWTAAMVQP